MNGHDKGNALTDEQAVRGKLDVYREAVLGKNVDAMMTLYDPAVVVFDTWGSWVHTGSDAWREMIAGWFESLDTDTCAVSFDDVHATVSGDLAFLRGVTTYQGINADGKKVRAMQNRLTWALEKKAGGWKIVHEHTSAPADMETGKVILKR